MALNTKRNDFKALERLIKHDPELRKEYLTSFSPFDFVPGDYVKCTYLVDLYKVTDIDGSYIVLKSIKTKENYIVSPEFIKKIALDKACVDLLFDK